MPIKFKKSRGEKDFHSLKFLLIFTVILILFFIIVTRISYIVTNKSYQTNYVKKNEEMLLRQNITDRNGYILATNVITYNLYAKLNEIKRPKELVESLHEAFPDFVKKNLFKKLKKSSSRRLVLLSRDLTPKQKRKIMSMGFVGLYFESDVKRIYPYKNLFSHIVGFVDSDEKGIAGIEKYYNHKLYDYSGLDHLKLSVDLNVQSIVREELAKQIEKFKALGGVGLVSDIKNGEILALVSLPDYDPHNPKVILSDKKYNNKASFELYELGSTLKLVTMAAALENEIVTDDEKFDVSEPIYISGFKITDYKKIEGEISPAEIITKSSNIGIAKIAMKMGYELQRGFLRKLDFFSPLEIEMIEKSHSNEPRRWGLSKAITASYGYGISLTTIHLIQAISAIVNGGDFMPATLVKGKNKELKSRKIVNNITSNKIREMMREVVEKGTGSKANSSLYEISGKTGTSNKVGERGYIEQEVVSSFVSFFPYENPQYVIYILVDSPQPLKETFGFRTGGWVAAPVVKNITEKIAPFLQVRPKF